VTDFLHLGTIISEENLKCNTCQYAFYYTLVYVRIPWRWEEKRRETGRCSTSVYFISCAEPSGSKHRMVTCGDIHMHLGGKWESFWTLKEKLLNPKTYNSCRTFTSDKRVALYLTLYLYKHYSTLRRTAERKWSSGLSYSAPDGSEWSAEDPNGFTSVKDLRQILGTRVDGSQYLGAVKQNKKK